MLVTGIKVVDLLAPYAKGGKIGLLWYWCWKNSIDYELINNVAKDMVDTQFLQVLVKELEEMIYIMK